ncbi:hypothetical protein HZC09_06505 [Candidatus Micrarchaeota archaeon]|nr:hypothetical protein [Candidatus Micrarchaeota archaeon]
MKQKKRNLRTNQKKGETHVDGRLFFLKKDASKAKGFAACLQMRQAFAAQHKPLGGLRGIAKHKVLR